MKFNTNTNDSLTLGYTNLKLENYNDIHDLRISYNIPKWIIGGDLKIDLERHMYTYGNNWQSTDFIYMAWDTLNNLKKFKSSLTWVSEKRAIASKDIANINFILTAIDDELYLEEIRTYGDTSKTTKNHGVILNKFNILVIKKLIKDKIEANR